MPADFELRADLFQIGGVFGDLRADGIGAIGSRGPAVGDVQQHHAALRQLARAA